MRLLLCIIQLPCERFRKLHQPPLLLAGVCLYGLSDVCTFHIYSPLGSIIFCVLESDLCGLPFPFGFKLSSTKGKYPLEISRKEESVVEYLFPFLSPCWVANGCGIKAIAPVSWPVSQSSASSLCILAAPPFSCSYQPRCGNSFLCSYCTGVFLCCCL